MEIMTRTEYLNYRKEWKKTYMVQALQIRALKFAVRAASKAGYGAQQEVNRQREGLQKIANKLQSMRALESNYAHFLMDELDMMKEHSRQSVAFLRQMMGKNE